jgi:hypothetical protein
MWYFEDWRYWGGGLFVVYWFIVAGSKYDPVWWLAEKFFEWLDKKYEEGE